MEIKKSEAYESIYAKLKKLKSGKEIRQIIYIVELIKNQSFEAITEKMLYSYILGLFSLPDASRNKVFFEL